MDPLGGGWLLQRLHVAVREPDRQLIVDERADDTEPLGERGAFRKRSTGAQSGVDFGGKACVSSTRPEPTDHVPKLFAPVANGPVLNQA